MPNCESIIREIKAAGISVWPGDGDKLCVLGMDKLTPEQVAYLRQHKREVLAYLRQRNADLLPPNEVCRAWRAKYANAHQEAAQ